MASEGSTGSGQLYHETPVLNIMGRELASFEDYQKTLSQLGYNSGSVLIRLSYKTTDQTLYEAMELISQFFKEDVQAGGASEAPEKPEEPVTAAEISGDTPMADAPSDLTPRNTQSEQPSHPSETAPLEPVLDPHTDTSKGEASSTALDEHNPLEPINVFFAPSGTTPAAALAPSNEKDYNPTVAHAQLHQSRLLDNSRNKRLLSDKELEEKAAAEEAKIAAVKSVLVRVRFPDNTSSEWQVGPTQTGAFLYEAVRHVMASKDAAFHLVLPGGKSVIKDSNTPQHSLIKSYKLSGRVLVNLVWEDSVDAAVRKQSFLKTSIARQGQNVPVPEVPQVAEEEEHTAPAIEPKKEKSSGDSGGKKLPKWLKLGKK